MTCVVCADGNSLRANNCLAPILGSLGLASGGSGSGLTVPLSCARADRVPAMIVTRSVSRIGRARMGSLYAPANGIGKGEARGSQSQLLDDPALCFVTAW